MKNLKKLTRKQLEFISGGDIAYGICDADGNCPRTIGSYYCNDGICYRVAGGGHPGGGCTEPKHLCQEWETGCGCVYI